MNAKSLLTSHNLRITKGRELLIQEFMDQNKALSTVELEDKFKSELDRVTIYRNLKSFLENGVVHKVIDSEEASRYALCKHHHHEEKHSDNHVHFKCINCQKSVCLDEISIPHINLPKGYNSLEMNLLIEGFCKDCS